MNEQDVYSLLIGYALFCIGVFTFVMITFHKHLSGKVELKNMPVSMLASIIFMSFFPLVNIVLLFNTIRLKPE